MFRACLMASDRRRWCGVQTPVRRRGTILPLSATNCAEQPHVLVVDGFDLLHAELANLLAAEILASAFAAAARARRDAADGARRSPIEDRSPDGRSPPAGRSRTVPAAVALVSSAMMLLQIQSSVLVVGPLVVSSSAASAIGR